ncbi:MAG: acyltransferase family protein [Alphaproteobacteria bacterium]|nr:acyltransferase family protein [Alphaproteobacteria bacterium]
MTWLDNSRILAIFIVILLHVSVGVAWPTEAGSLLWYYTTSTDILVRCCVPLFVMISGALLLDPNKQESLSDFYRKRFSKILLPLIVWSLFYIVWGYYRENIQEEFSVSYVVKRLASGKPYYHLWFMYMLMGLYAFTPVFRAVVAHLKTKELVFFIAMTFVIETIQAVYEAWYVGESNLFLTWFLTYVPFYFTGYLVRSQTLPISTGKLALIVLGIGIAGPALACWTALNLHNGEVGYFYKNLCATNILFAVALMFLLKRMDRPVFGAKVTATLASFTFGIYFLHMVPLAYLHDLQDVWALLSPYLYVPVFSVVIMIVTALLVWGMAHVPYLKRLV